MCYKKILALIENDELEFKKCGPIFELPSAFQDDDPESGDAFTFEFDGFTLQPDTNALVGKSLWCIPCECPFKLKKWELAIYEILEDKVVMVGKCPMRYGTRSHFPQDFEVLNCSMVVKQKII